MTKINYIKLKTYSEESFSLITKCPKSCIVIEKYPIKSFPAVIALSKSRTTIVTLIGKSATLLRIVRILVNKLTL
jgi:hypothetical protein